MVLADFRSLVPSGIKISSVFVPQPTMFENGEFDA